MDLINKYLGERRGKTKAIKINVTRDQLAKISDKELITYAKKLDSMTDVDSQAWNMVIDEIEKRGLKF